MKAGEYMYNIKIIDENGRLSYFSIGRFPKSYDSVNSANKEIDHLLQWEINIFGNVLTKYEVVNETQDIIDYVAHQYDKEWGIDNE